MIRSCKVAGDFYLNNELMQPIEGQYYGSVTSPVVRWVMQLL